ncbi:MAG: cysteine desulfurase [Oscillospiraceae bacterium]|nr:cysteine desulfurase [Oscillospiraceae bacterium]
MIYLDHAATTPPSKAAIDAFNNALEYANPSSLHGQGQKARKLLERSRAVIAEKLNAAPEEIIFTSGGTEANALALNVSGHKLTTELEHPSVRENADTLANPYQLIGTIQDNTAIISCIYVCNETGSIQPIADIAKEIKGRGILLHTDAVQAFGKIDCNVKKLGVDLMTMSAHKIGGIRGVAALYVRKGVKIKPLWLGGGQENGLRPGTESLPLIAAFAAAAQRESTDTRPLIDYLLELLPNKLPNVIIVPGHGAPHIIALELPRCPGQVAVRMLSDMGVYVSSGSACSRGKTSPVLKALGVKQPDNVIRISFGEGNTKEDVDELVKALGIVLEKFI